MIPPAAKQAYIDAMRPYIGLWEKPKLSESLAQLRRFEDQTQQMLKTEA